VPGKLRLRRRIDRIPDAIPDLLRAGGSGSNLEVIGEIYVGYQFFHNKFCHGGTTNVAVADEKYFYHSFDLLLFALKCPVLRGISGIIVKCSEMMNVANQSRI
jgi:hypothetical protein